MNAVGLLRIIGVAGVAGALACFSEREATAPVNQVCGLPLGGDVPGSTLSTMLEFAFQPGEIRVPAGQRITWVNCETNGAPHTSTADGGEWQSALLQPGDRFTQEFLTPGSFSYFCEVHPFMTGTVVVE